MVDSGRNSEIHAVLDQAECLYTETQISTALDTMAGRLAVQLEDTEPLFLCVMVGALMTTSALLTRMPFPVQVDYLQVSRYRGSTRGGKLVWRHEPEIPLQDRTVVVVDDILDEGDTLNGILDYCNRRGARQVLSAVLVAKCHDRRPADLSADVVGLEVDDRYVFGFGMDYKHHFRNLPAVYAVRDHDAVPAGSG